MDILIRPGKLSGALSLIPSKSLCHRYLICAAFSQKPVTLLCPETNQDIEATVDCLRTLGARIHRTNTGYEVHPIQVVPEQAVLNCRESGSTLRFLLPVVGALGISAIFRMEGRLPSRPLSPLWEEMERMGCALSRPSENTIFCQGKLQTGTYTIAGNVSSQFLSGLLFAIGIMGGASSLEVTGEIVSLPYFEMTKAAIERFSRPENVPDVIPVEGDWSNGAFWVAANALGSSLQLLNLNEDSIQGDRACIRLIPQLQKHSTISAQNIPDLIPVLAVVAAANCGAVFTQTGRLRSKESDRVAAILGMIRSLGGQADATADTLTVYGTGLTGGCVDSCRDHRIAMAAAIASTVCSEPVTILNAECVEKSYPRFWEEFRRTGGNYEQYLR